MALETVVVNSTTPTSTGTVDYNGTGFGTPTAAIVFVGGSLSASTTTDDGHLSIGLVGKDTGITQNVSSVYQEYGVGTSVTSREHNDGAVVILQENGTDIIKGIATAFSTTGLTINWTTVDASNQYPITIVLLKGTTSAKAVTRILSTSTTYDITNFGFQPDLTIFAAICYGSIDNSDAHSIISFGAAHNNSSDVVTHRGLFASNTDASATVNVSADISETYCIGQILSGTLGWAGSTSTYDSSGFTLTTTASPNSDYIMMLGLELSDPDAVDLISIDTGTTATTKAYTGVGFQPETIILAQSRLTAYDTIDNTDTAAAIGISAADSTTEGSVGYTDDDANSTARAKSFHSASGCGLLYSQNSASSTKEIECSIDSFDSDGFTLDFTTAETTARKWWALSFEGSGTAPITKTTSLNAVVQKQDNLKTTSLSAALQKAMSEATSLDAILTAIAAGTKTTSLDAALQKSASKTTLLDAALQEAYTKATSLDAILQKAAALTTSLDAILTSPGSTLVSTSLDSVLQATSTLVTSIDAALQKSLAKTSSLDAIILEVKTLTASLDASLTGTLLKTISMDAVLSSGGVLTHTITALFDAVIRDDIWSDVTPVSSIWTDISKTETVWS